MFAVVSQIWLSSIMPRYRGENRCREGTPRSQRQTNQNAESAAGSSFCLFERDYIDFVS
jgi:hypothetical protein